MANFADLKRRLQGAFPAIPDAARRSMPALFAVVLAAVAALLTHRLIAQERAKLEKERQRLMANYPEPVEIVVAASDLPIETKLSRDHLHMAKVPPPFVQPYAVDAPEDILGMYTTAPIAAGEQVLKNKLRSADEIPRGTTLSSVISQGKRATTIEVNAITGVGGFVRPGDQVDVIWTFKLPEGEQKDQTIAITMFQDVPVLAVGHQIVGSEKPEGEQAASAEGQLVTLALTPQETSLLLFAREHGAIQLALRARADGGPVAVAPANMNTLMEKVLGAPQAQAPQPPNTHEVEVFKGLERNVVVLPDDRPGPAPETLKQ